MPRYRSEQTRESDKKYREAHRKEATSRAKAWVAANPEKRQETERRYRAANKEKMRLKKKEWRKNNPDKQHAAARRWRVNKHLGVDEFNALLVKQNGLCAICGSPSPRRNGSTHFTIDHCHMTGIVRGLLCFPCNTMLGLVLDAVEILRKSITCLEKNHDCSPLC